MQYNQSIFFRFSPCFGIDRSAPHSEKSSSPLDQANSLSKPNSPIFPNKTNSSFLSNSSISNSFFAPTTGQHLLDISKNKNNFPVSFRPNPIFSSDFYLLSSLLESHKTPNQHMFEPPPLSPLNNPQGHHFNFLSPTIQQIAYLNSINKNSDDLKYNHWDKSTVNQNFFKGKHIFKSNNTSNYLLSPATYFRILVQEFVVLFITYVIKLSKFLFAFFSEKKQLNFYPLQFYK